MNSFIDLGFGRDIFGMFKKSQFVKGVLHSIFQTLSNMQKSLNEWSKDHMTVFDCDENGNLVDVVISPERTGSS